MASNSPANSLDFYESLLKEIEQLVKSDPGNKNLKYELSTYHTKLGNIQLEQGNLTAAMISYMSASKIIKQLLESYPHHSEWQYDLCGIYELIGKIQQVQGDIAAALSSIELSLKIRRELGKSNPINNQRLSELAASSELCLKLKELHTKNNPLNKNISRLNSLYGDMTKAMQGNKPDKTESRGNPALNKIEDMLSEAEKENYPIQNEISENVNFAVSFPATIIAAESYILDVWLFLEEQRNNLLSRIKEESSENTGIKSAGSAIIERGTAITARLVIDSLITEPQEKTLIWTGNLNNSSFVVTVPQNSNEGSKIGQVYFYINGLEISRLHFKVQISAKQKEELKLANGFASGLKYKTAFASYASDDRNDVLARVQGLEKAGIDVFMDVRNLRSGERYEEKLLEKIRVTDIFYLFWSTAAKKSEWVRKEWEYALNNRGIDFINPIPLESPEIAPPPAELGQALHFGDWTLAYKRSKSQ